MGLTLSLLAVGAAGYVVLVAYLRWLTKPWRRGDPR